MRANIARTNEWCHCNVTYGWEPRLCPVDSYVEWEETKCPDLGDWSDTPHDELDGELKTDSEYRHPMAYVLESILTSADW
jgi:hypothetical protein